MRDNPTLEELAGELAAGRATARSLAERCLARIESPGGQGREAFVAVDRQGVLAMADAMDALRRAGGEPSRFAGIPVSIKDLFDVRGETTRAGSVVLDAGPAASDAPAVARLRRAGFIPIGRTNMTEFAFSGLGLNPHYGTPLSGWDRAGRRISGGSTSGGAVSVMEEMAHAALGTDTGGSCRIPAAWCGLVGWKPTAGRVPREGAVPLSQTLDSIGPIARSVACCAALDGILAGNDPADIAPPAERSPKTLRFLAPKNYVLEGMDETVATTFYDALERLGVAGARIEMVSVPEFDDIPAINAKGGFAAAEAWAWHRELILREGERYDPRVLVRIRRGVEQEAADYVDLLAAREKLIAGVAARMQGYDALLMPTVPIVAPRLSDLIDDDDAYGRVNLLALRNPTAINMIDGCAISLPIHRPGEAPVGLMLAGLGGGDARIFSVAASAERELAR